MKTNNFADLAASAHMSPISILNFYRNTYFREPLTTEQGLVANALNEILPEYMALLRAKQNFEEGDN